MLKTLSLVALSLGAAAAPLDAAAGAAEGGDLPKQITVDDEQLALNGAGVYEATIFNVDVFVAGLYLAKPTADAASILSSDQTRCLALRFKRDVGRGKLIEAAGRALGDPSSARGDRSSRARLKRFFAGLPDAQDGDILLIRDHPRHGLEVVHNGDILVRIADKGLARDVFASWVGPKALDEALGRALLGHS